MSYLWAVTKRMASLVVLVVVPQAILFCCSGKQLFASIIRSEQLRLLLKQLVATGTNILSELGALFHVIFVVVPDVKQMIKYYLITQ